MSGEARREEIRATHRKYRLFYELLGGAVLLSIGVAIGAGFFGLGNRDYHMNLFTEGMGIVVTVIIINRWYEHRSNENLKRRLLQQVREGSTDVASNALSWLRSEGWLEGNSGLLQGKDLSGANLQAANLRNVNLKDATLDGANLERADLRNAELHRANLANGVNLEGANLSSTELQEANLTGTNLKRALLVGANLKGAKLFFANMQNANLSRINLERAKLFNVNLQDVDLQMADLRNTILRAVNLQNANLLGVYLEGAQIKFDKLETNLYVGDKPPDNESIPAKKIVYPPTILEGAVLPDWTNYKENVDLKRFTDPEDPKFETTLETIKLLRSNPMIHEEKIRQHLREWNLTLAD